ncbi:type 1 glutamine amidotransferase domain-containing protein [Sphingopyxis sp. LARHCG72]
MRRFLPAILLAIGLATSPPALAAPAEKVLIVVSGHGADGGKTRPGFEFDEFAQAYAVFRDNGLEVEVASPRGGRVEADEYDPAKPYNARVLADAKAMAALSATRPTGTIRAGDHAAIFIVGGKGAMFDLPRDTALRKLLADSHAAGRVIGAVCHGPAALVGVKRRDGTPLLAGVAATGFTNEEEALFGKRWSKDFPFLLEDALRAEGSRYAEAAIMLPFVQSGDRIVTGQNPFSTSLAADAVIRAMKKQPASRATWTDERSLLLVARFLAGETEAVERELTANPGQYDMPLIAMYGYSLTQVPAAEPDTLANALAIMALAEPHFAHPKLQLAMADAEQRTGQTNSARQRLKKLLARQPDMKEARAMLTDLAE